MNPRSARSSLSVVLLLCLLAAASSAQDTVTGGGKTKAKASQKVSPAQSSSSSKSSLAIVVPPLVISEFRLRGAAGANDEFIEIYNAGNSPHTVQSSDGSGGYGVAASDGSVRFFIPNNTVIPARGHYLGVNNTVTTGYSLAAYPAGNSTTATGNATYTTDIPDNTGIALFTTAIFANFSAATRIDSVGFTTEANPLFKEGAGMPLKDASNIEYTMYRNLVSGLPKDTDDNASDFLYADTNGTQYNLTCSGLPAGFACQRLGAPGPENSSSPIFRGASIKASLIDPGCPGTSSGTASASLNGCERHRDFTSDPANNSTFGTLSIRRNFTNNTGAALTRLRFRVVDVTTFVAPPGTADLRPRTSATYVAGLSGGGVATVKGLTLEQPPSQPNGGGYNSSLSDGTVTLGTPLANGAATTVHFLLGIQQTGNFRFFIIVEALP